MPEDARADTGWAWIVSVACAFINCITFGIFRSYGVIYVELLQQYDVSRGTASWPFSLCMTITYLSGPIASALNTYFPIRQIVFIGTLISSIGICACFFARSFLEITLFIGLIQGFGVGLTFMQTPVIISQYFHRYRATATGIAYAGGTIGSFLFPHLMEYILHEYGLHGSFLIIGGIVLHALPASMLLRPAIPFRVHTPRIEKETVQCSDTLLCTCIELNGRIHEEITKSLISAQINAEIKLERLAKSSVRARGCRCIEKQEQYEREMTEMIQEQNGVMNMVQRQFSVLRNPLFIILAITHVSFQWSWMTYQMVIVDHGVDHQMTTSEAVILLSSFAGSDLIGRLMSGYFADKNIVRKRTIVSVCILLIGVLLWMIPACESFECLLSLTIALGFTCGSIIVLFSVLTIEYVGLDHLPTALGTSAFAVGASTCVRPLVVGYFRDTHGTYDGLFQFIAILCFVAALFWLSEPFARIWMQRRTNRGFRVFIV